MQQTSKIVIDQYFYLSRNNGKNFDLNVITNNLRILFCSYLQALEWILIYSTVPITFHVITNEDSVPYVTKVLDKLNETSESDFQKQILTLSEIISRSNNEICPKLGVRSEFCEIVMGNMTPLLFPWLFPKLDHAIYIDRNIVFQVNYTHYFSN